MPITPLHGIEKSESTRWNSCGIIYFVDWSSIEVVAWDFITPWPMPWMFTSFSSWILKLSELFLKVRYLHQYLLGMWVYF